MVFLLGACDERFTASRRLKRRSDFLRVQRTGRKYHSRHFLLSVYKSSTDKDSRIGITITRKVHKRAVRRNLLKRRIREIFRQEYKHIFSGLELVVIAKSGATELSFREISMEIIGLFKRAKIKG